MEPSPDDVRWRAEAPPLSANPLDRARQLAHREFDRLWKREKKAERKRARGRAYRWLARELGLNVEQCHIRKFDEATCRKVTELSKARVLWAIEEERIRKRGGRRVGRE